MYPALRRGFFIAATCAAALHFVAPGPAVAADLGDCQHTPCNDNQPLHKCKDLGKCSDCCDPGTECFLKDCTPTTSGCPGGGCPSSACAWLCSRGTLKYACAGKSPTCGCSDCCPSQTPTCGKSGTNCASCPKSCVSLGRSCACSGTNSPCCCNKCKQTTYRCSPFLGGCQACQVTPRKCCDDCPVQP